MAAHNVFSYKMCIWYGLDIYEFFHSKSYLNSGFWLGWEAQSGFFLALYPGLFSRLLHVGYFPHFVNQARCCIFHRIVESFWLKRSLKGHLVEHLCHVQGYLERARDLALGPFEPREGPKEPLHEFVQVPLNGIRSLRHLNSTVCVTDGDMATGYLMFTVLLSIVQSITNLI